MAFAEIHPESLTVTPHRACTVQNPKLVQKFGTFAPIQFQIWNVPISRNGCPALNFGEFGRGHISYGSQTNMAKSIKMTLKNLIIKKSEN